MKRTTHNSLGPRLADSGSARECPVSKAFPMPSANPECPAISFPKSQRLAMPPHRGSDLHGCKNGTQLSGDPVVPINLMVIPVDGITCLKILLAQLSKKCVDLTTGGDLGGRAFTVFEGITTGSGLTLRCRRPGTPRPRLGPARRYPKRLQAPGAQAVGTRLGAIPVRLTTIFLAHPTNTTAQLHFANSGVFGNSWRRGFGVGDRCG